MMQKSRGNRMKISRIKTPAIGALGLLMTAWSLPAHSNGDCVTHFQTLYGSGAGTTYAAAGCQTCHTSSMASQDCLLCHKYHVNGVITPIMNTRIPVQ